MATIKDAAAEFLSRQRVAVTGVSRRPQTYASNAVYKRLRDRGYQVFAVNPNADEVEGDRAYHNLASIPGGVDAVVIGTRPDIADETMRECVNLGIKHVWMHRGPGAGSVSKAAAEYGRGHGVKVIDGGCPCMFGPTADFGHRAMSLVFTLNGNVPKDVRLPGGYVMTRYEYKVIDTGSHIEEQLNDLGAQGWRVAGVTTKKQLFIAPPQAIILMREVVDIAKAA
jgi:predicted CoA-binding protein